MAAAPLLAFLAAGFGGSAGLVTELLAALLESSGGETGCSFSLAACCWPALAEAGV